MSKAKIDTHRNQWNDCKELCLTKMIIMNSLKAREGCDIGLEITLDFKHAYLGCT